MTEAAEHMTFEETFSKIADLTAGILELPREEVVETSNFFMLGGTSAGALELCLKIEQRFLTFFDEDGIDTALIVTQPDLGHFVRALLSVRPALAVNEGEL